MDLLNKANELLNGINVGINKHTQPSIADFESFSLGTACMEKYAEYEAKLLKIRSAHLGAEVLLETSRTLLEGACYLENNPIDVDLDINLDGKLSRIANPKITSLPECLDNTKTGKMTENVKKSANSAFNKATENPNSMIGKVNDFLSGAGDMINSVNNTLNDGLKMIADAADLPLFKSFDALLEYLSKTDYIKQFKEIKEMRKCLEENCKPLKDMLMDDGFLYYDKKKKHFIMPININSGKLKVASFFEKPTAQQKKECAKIQSRYNKYLNKKKKLAEKMKKDAKRLGGNNKMMDAIDKVASISNDIGSSIDSITSKFGF